MNLPYVRFTVDWTIDGTISIVSSSMNSVNWPEKSSLAEDGVNKGRILVVWEISRVDFFS